MSEEVRAPEPPAIGHPAGLGWERAVFGSGSIEGTMRMVVYAAAFVLLFGTLFWLAQG